MGGAPGDAQSVGVALAGQSYSRDQHDILYTAHLLLHVPELMVGLSFRLFRFHGAL